MHSVVQDAMEEFTDQIHNDFLCMQMNILHMFQQQQVTTFYDAFYYYRSVSNNLKFICVNFLLYNILSF